MVVVLTDNDPVQVFTTKYTFNIVVIGLPQATEKNATTVILPTVQVVKPQMAHQAPNPPPNFLNKPLQASISSVNQYGEVSIVFN